MTIAEAMALGLPVVAGRDSGAVPWVLGTDDGGGALVDIRSPEKIAEALLAILADPALYERYSGQGRVRASTYFSSSSVVQAYLGHYRRVLADSCAPVVLSNEMSA